MVKRHRAICMPPGEDSTRLVSSGFPVDGQRVIIVDPDNGIQCSDGQMGDQSGFPRIRTVMADAGYESRKLARELKRRHGWRLHITKRRQRAFKVVGLNGSWSARLRGRAE